MRRLLAAAAVLLALAGVVEVVRADDVQTGVVVCTATRNHVITSNVNRRGGFLQNVGTIHVNVGRGVQMATLHVGAVLEMTPGYKGGLDCQTAVGDTAVEWYQELN